MRRPYWKNVYEFPQEHTGFFEAAATLFIFGMFLIAYYLRAQQEYSELLIRCVFLAGTTTLCGMYFYGALVRHFVPFVSQVIVAGAAMMVFSQVVGFFALVPAFHRVPLIGPAGWGYFGHYENIFLFPGILLLLSGFHLSIHHAAKMRRELIREGQEKEEALQRSVESATVLARRVAFENLATGVSTRFINLGLDTIDGEIDRSLEELGQFADVDRAFITFSKPDLSSLGESFEWCAAGVAPIKGVLLEVPIERFGWALSVLARGESINARRVEDLPAEAAFESQWLAEQGVRSILNVPIMSNNILRGYIGFMTVSQETDWSDEVQPLLGMIGEILLSAWDRRCAEEQRRLLEVQVQQAQKLESLGVMAGGIAHDFNNLLTGIMGNAELARLDMDPDTDRYRYLLGVNQSACRAAELCRQMLAYAGKGKFVEQSIDLNGLLNDMRPLLRASAPSRCELVFDLAENLPEVDGDVGQFRQVVGNLVTNASESIGEHAGTVLIKTGRRKCTDAFLRDTYLAEPLATGEYVYLEVSDTGSGMTAAVKEKIFEPFYTTRFAGRGLGLSAVLGIVRGHKGALRINSEVGRGTTVQAYFPVNSTAKKSCLAVGERHGDWHGHGTVLLADDEDMVLSVGSMMLRHLGMDVVTAASGDEVVASAHTHSKSLQCVILDYEMPGLESEVACAQLKEAFPEVPVVIASGHAELDITGHFDGESVAGFLAKPFTLSGLQQLLGELLTPTSRCE